MKPSFPLPALVIAALSLFSAHHGVLAQDPTTTTSTSSSSSSSSSSSTSTGAPTTTTPPPATPPPTSTTTSAGGALATYPATRLAQKGPFAYPNGIPYKVDTDLLARGPQHGYNICNSTTEGQTSLCQTAWLNSLNDFCLWGPPEMGRQVGDIEGIMVAYCSKPGHGTRLIPSGALTGVQFIKTPDYVQVVGFIDQTKINILKEDWGGEMDPHGADGRGNPMGGIMYSDSFTGSPVQVIQWHNFIGGNRFCMKLCDGRNPNDRHFCEHIYDRIGLDYNCPTNAKDGVFESCDGESQDFPGTYTTNGQVMTYTQPPESLGAISTITYTARTPAVSNCKTFSSAAVFTGLPSAAGGASSTGGLSTTKSTTSAGATGTGSTDIKTGGAAIGAELGFGLATVLIGFVSSVALLI